MRKEKEQTPEIFPDKENIASVMGSLYGISVAYFEEKRLMPKIVVRGHYQDGKISDIAFENLTSDMAHELADKIRSSRPHAWGHVEAFANNEETQKSSVRLFADLAYVPSR